MAPKHHPTPLSGGDRKALKKELGKARAMTGILAAQSAEVRAKAETLLQQADRLLCESWNERMWADGDHLAQQPFRVRLVADAIEQTDQPLVAIRRRSGVIELPGKIGFARLFEELPGLPGGTAAEVGRIVTWTVRAAKDIDRNTPVHRQ